MVGSRLAAATRTLLRRFWSASPAGGNDAKVEDRKTVALPTVALPIAALDAGASPSASSRWTKRQAKICPDDGHQTETGGESCKDNDITQTGTQSSSDKMNFDKENLPPGSELAGLAAALDELDVGSQPVVMVEEEEPEKVKARQQNLHFIGEALDMAQLALRTNETPVGCVLVRDGIIIAKGMNATNVTRNGTRHAELMAIGALLSVAADEGPRPAPLKPRAEAKSGEGGVEEASSTMEGNDEDGSKGRLYPYGQKLVADKRVDPAILRESILYVTVEPCVMCASLLRQLGIKKVYFGAVNDKFGGTGGVFSIHANSLPVGGGTMGMSYPPGGGDGGNVEDGYDIEGGWGRDEAVGLLRRFYVQENGRAPVPRKKEGRVARLAAMMGQDDEPLTASLCDRGRRADDELAGDEGKERTTAEAGSDLADDDDDNYLGLTAGSLPRRGGLSMMPAGDFSL